jgi:hypothetical protein
MGVLVYKQDKSLSCWLRPIIQYPLTLHCHCPESYLDKLGEGLGISSP